MATPYGVHREPKGRGIPQQQATRIPARPLVSAFWQETWQRRFAKRWTKRREYDTSDGRMVTRYVPAYDVPSVAELRARHDSR